MKKIIVCCLAVMLGGKVLAQSNNPYAYVGKDYLASYERVEKDYQEGKIKELNEATLQFYQEQLPLQHRMNMDLAAEVIRTYKDQPISLSRLMDKARVSEFTRKATLDILFNSRNLDYSEFKPMLVSMNDEISRQEISKEEKQLLYTLTAIGYALPDKGEMSKKGCRVETVEGNNDLGYWDCILLSAGIGVYIGWPFCGFWCGLGGGLFFGILTAIILS